MEIEGLRGVADRGGESVAALRVFALILDEKRLGGNLGGDDGLALLCLVVVDEESVGRIGLDGLLRRKEDLVAGERVGIVDEAVRRHLKKN